MISSNQEIKFGRSTSDSHEINFSQLLRYFFTHRNFIAMLTFSMPILVLTWTILFKSHVYRADVVVNMDLNSDDRQASPAASMFFTLSDLLSYKGYLVEQYFESNEYQQALYESIASKTSSSGTGRDDILTIKKYLATFGPSGAGPNSEAESEFIYSHLSLKSNPDKYRLEVTALAANNRVAAALANVAAKNLVEMNSRVLLKRILSLKDFLQAQTDQTHTELKQLEEELVVLQKSERLFSPDEIKTRVSAVMIDRNLKYDELKKSLTAIELLKKETEADLNSFKDLLKSSKNLSYLYLEQMQRRLEVLKFQKSQILNERNISSVQQDDINASIANVQREMSHQIESKAPISSSPWDYIRKLENLTFELNRKNNEILSEISALESSQSKTEKRFINLPDSIRRYNELRRKIEVTSNLYTQLKSKLQETEIRQAGHANDLLILSEAPVPEIPYGMSKKRAVLLSAPAGLTLALIVLFLKFLLVPVLRNPDELELMGMPALFSLPEIRSRSLPSFNLKAASRLILEIAPNSAEANTLRYTRFQIDQLFEIRKRKNINEAHGPIFSVTSSTPGEGKSFLTANMAHVFSMSEYKVLILNLDLSEDPYPDYFAKSARPPVATDLPYKGKMEFKLTKYSENLAVVNSSYSSAALSEEIESTHFKRFLERLSEEYNIILVDTPSIKGNLEAMLITQLVDAVFYTVNQRTTLKEDIHRFAGLLRRSTSAPIYSVLNYAPDDLSFQALGLDRFFKRSA